MPHMLRCLSHLQGTALPALYAPSRWSKIAQFSSLLMSGGHNASSSWCLSLCTNSGSREAISDSAGSCDEHHNHSDSYSTDIPARDAGIGSRMHSHGRHRSIRTEPLISLLGIPRGGPHSSLRNDMGTVVNPSLSIQDESLSSLHGGLHDGSYVTSSNSSGSSVSAEAEDDIVDSGHRFLQVGLVGAPNAGKSELTNRLCSSKVTAVSSKRNTTVAVHLGAFTSHDTQVLLMDTPGLVQPIDYQHMDQKTRVANAWRTASDCSVLLFIVDAERQFAHRPASVYGIAQTLAAGPPRHMVAQWSRPRSILVLNKIDKLQTDIRKVALDALEAKFRNLADFDQVFRISAMLGHGVDDLRSYLLEQARPGEWALPAEQSTDKSPEALSTELVREQLYRRFNQSVPYQLNPVLVSCTSQSDGSLRIQQMIPVKTVHLKGIILGPGGSIMRDYILPRARQDLERLTKRRVQLDVEVRVVKR